MGLFILKKNMLRCPKCGGIYEKSDGYTNCFDCGYKLITEDEYRKYGLRAHVPKVECPYCHADDVKKISTANRMVSTGMFGMASKKLGKQWHCNIITRLPYNNIFSRAIDQRDLR